MVKDVQWRDYPRSYVYQMCNSEGGRERFDGDMHGGKGTEYIAEMRFEDNDDDASSDVAI